MVFFLLNDTSALVLILSIARLLINIILLVAFDLKILKNTIFIQR